MKTQSTLAFDIAEKIALKMFRFFASLRLAVISLITLMSVLSVGTVIESLHGTEAARILVYETNWFSLLLLLLGLNVAAAALDRLPWKKKHTGFVITHIGILVILAGSFVTQKMMIDGQIILEEKETTQEMSLGKPLFYIFQEEAHRDWLFELRPHAFSWQGKKTLLKSSAMSDIPKPFSVHLRSYYPKAVMEEKFVEAKEGAPAIKIKIKNAFVSESAWLWKDDPKHGKTQMGPATLVFTGTKLQETEASEISKLGYLEIELKGERHHLPIPENLKETRTLKAKGSDVEVEILGYFRNAVVEGKTLIDQKETEAEAKNVIGKNPAIRLKLRASGKEELHTVFAKFPDFPTIHGMKPSDMNASLAYRLPGSGSKGQTHELRFVQLPEGLFYQVQTGMKVETFPLKIGAENRVSWMNMQFTAQVFYPHAALEKNFLSQSPNTKAENAMSAIEVEIEQDQKTKSVWLGQGVRETVEFNGVHYVLTYGDKMTSAGFSLTLRDFRMTTDPGTNNPASFESDVTLRDDLRGVVMDAKISMNEPLVYRGWRIYQSGYAVNPGVPEISIFSVGKDPGIPLKYGGTIIMVLGIILMFYFRSYSRAGGTL